MSSCHSLAFAVVLSVPVYPKSSVFLRLDPVEDFMNLACSSVLRGGGTNQELALHCLHQCGGNVLVSHWTCSSSPLKVAFVFFVILYLISSGLIIKLGLIIMPLDFFIIL